MAGGSNPPVLAFKPRGKVPLFYHNGTVLAGAWCVPHAALQKRVALAGAIDPLWDTSVVHTWVAGFSPASSCVSVRTSGAFVDDESLGGRVF